MKNKYINTFDSFLNEESKKQSAHLFEDNSTLEDKLLAESLQKWLLGDNMDRIKEDRIFVKIFKEEKRFSYTGKAYRVVSEEFKPNSSHLHSFSKSLKGIATFLDLSQYGGMIDNFEHLQVVEDHVSGFDVSAAIKYFEKLQPSYWNLDSADYYMDCEEVIANHSSPVLRFTAEFVEDSSLYQAVKFCRGKSCKIVYSRNRF